jgi:Tfp pilus assembly protein PilO
MESDHNATGLSLRAKLRERNGLRWTIAGATLIIGLFAIHWPATEYRRVLQQRLNNEKSRNQLAAEVVSLRGELLKYKAHIPEGAGANEWRQYVLEELRNSMLATTSIEPGKTEQFGPYQLVALKLEVEGSYPDLDAFLERIENNRRLLRIDQLSISSGKNADNELTIQLTISGIIG